MITLTICVFSHILFSFIINEKGMAFCLIINLTETKNMNQKLKQLFEEDQYDLRTMPYDRIKRDKERRMELNIHRF